MKKITILFVMIACFVLNAYASDIKMKITEAENAIRNNSQTAVKYKKGMDIGSEILSEPVNKALEAKKEYEDSDLEEYKELESNVIINLKGAYKNVSLNLKADINEFKDFIDNIIININGMYCFINTAEFAARNNNKDDVLLTIKDSGNIVAKYNGTASINTLKMVVMASVLFIIIYILLFFLCFVRKNNFREGFNKKKIYVGGIMIMIISALFAVALYFIDLSAFISKQPLKASKINNAVIEAELGEGSDKINGIYLALPSYCEDFDDYIAACMKVSSGEKIIGGNYNNVFDVLKFPMNMSGQYYIRNNEVEFSDVKENSDETLYEAVSMLASKNIISGKTENVYGVEDTIKRCEAVTMMCKMLYLEGSNSTDSKFDDISKDDWYYEYVITGTENGIITGYENNTFRADNTITREEFAGILGQIMVKRLNYVIPTDFSNLSKYSDRDAVYPWAEGYISLLETENINIWEDEYIPKKPITRGEAAIMLYRVYNLIK